MYRLGDLLDGQRRLDPALGAIALETVAQRQRIDDGRQHPHVVGVGPIHARGCVAEAAKDVASTHHDGHLVALTGDLGDLLGGAIDGLGIDAVAEIDVGERLTRQFEDDSPFRHVDQLSPISTRAMDATEMFSPIFAASCWTSSPTVPSKRSVRT